MTLLMTKKTFPLTTVLCRLSLARITHSTCASFFKLIISFGAWAKSACILSVQKLVFGLFIAYGCHLIRLWTGLKLHDHLIIPIFTQAGVTDHHLFQWKMWLVGKKSQNNQQAPKCCRTCPQDQSVEACIRDWGGRSSLVRCTPEGEHQSQSYDNVIIVTKRIT